MTRHRTAARGVFLLAVIVGLTAGGAAARPAAPGGKVPQLIFPVVGQASYVDDFGDARGQGSHQGNDIMAPKRSLAVAVEAGTVKFHTTSSRAGCMLYLEGASGTEYLYIHLNNDLTRANDNAGRCVAGVAYARGLRSGDRVQPGEPLAYVGDSGDADGIASHLHFEVHPNGGGAVSPYQYLRRAKKLLFGVQPGNHFTAALRGSVVEAFNGSLTLRVKQVQSWPGGLRVPNVDRNVELMVPPSTIVFNPLGAVIAAAKLASLEPGQGAVAFTERALATLEAQLGEPFSLATERVELSG
ncbi:MAG: M23 family metallopeptidase [Gaiellaceae bacterium]